MYEFADLLVCWVPVAPQDSKYIDLTIDLKTGGGIRPNAGKGVQTQNLKACPAVPSQAASRGRYGWNCIGPYLKCKCC